MKRLLLRVPKGKGPAATWRSHGEAPGPVRRQKEQKENVGESLHCDFLKREHARQGKQVRQIQN